MDKKDRKVLFEVIRDGRVMMSTEHKSCIYPTGILLAMQSAGYKFRMDGKAWKPAKPEKKLPSAGKKNRKSNT
ncbi:MAG: hypothetical protein FWC32_00575 [Firmicutes bacterium]|nr:hypothetical protein [Bacillota bacterium]